MKSRASPRPPSPEPVREDTHSNTARLFVYPLTKISELLALLGVSLIV